MARAGPDAALLTLARSFGAAITVCVLAAAVKLTVVAGENLTVGGRF
jgi:hypothetical protein